MLPPYPTSPAVPPALTALCRAILAAIFALFLFAFTFNGASAQDDAAYNGAFIWQGFSHQWQYNHKLDKFGDYVEQSACNGQTCSGKLTHTAATDALNDKARFYSKVNILKSRKLAFKTDSVTFTLKGKRGDIFKERKVTAFYASGLPYRQVNYLTLLNGFKIRSLAEPANVQLFDVFVTDGQLDALKDSIFVGVGAEFQAGCKGLCRCKWFDKTVEYEITSTSC